jgi:hypothetical protein
MRTTVVLKDYLVRKARKLSSETTLVGFLKQLLSGLDCQPYSKRTEDAVDSGVPFRATRVPSHEWNLDSLGKRMRSQTFLMKKPSDLCELGVSYESAVSQRQFLS